MTNLYINYLDGFISNIEKYQEHLRESPNLEDDKHIKKLYIKRSIFYGVKAVINGPKDDFPLNKASTNFEFANTIANLMGSLKPKEFINIFPINKEYDGHKYQSKDYFYTKKYMDSLNQSKPIGEEILHLLWEYQNMDITLFNIKMMGYMDDMRRLRGKPNVIEEFFSNYEDDSVETIKKKYPSYLKLIK